jgi:hypothetical protein
MHIIDTFETMFKESTSNLNFVSCNEVLLSSHKKLQTTTKEFKVNYIFKTHLIKILSIL